MPRVCDWYYFVNGAFACLPSVQPPRGNTHSDWVSPGVMLMGARVISPHSRPCKVIAVSVFATWATPAVRFVHMFRRQCWRFRPVLYPATNFDDPEHRSSTDSAVTHHPVQGAAAHSAVPLVMRLRPVSLDTHSAAGPSQGCAVDCQGLVTSLSDGITERPSLLMFSGAA